MGERPASADSKQQLARSVPCLARASLRISRTCGLDRPAATLRFVSGARQTALERLGLATVRDVLLHVPRRYLDFSHSVPIGQTDMGQDVTVVGTVDAVRTKRPRPKMVIVEVDVHDDSGVLTATFFRKPWLSDQIHVGDKIALSGKVSFYRGFRQLKAPFHEVLSSEGEGGSYARVLPVHPLSEGVTAAWMRRIISAALADAGDVVDPVPADLVASHDLMTQARALREVHYPSSMNSAHDARRRLAYDELLSLQLALLCRRRIAQDGIQAHEHVVDGAHVAALRAALPFAPSDEQEQAIREILADMAAPALMSRLLLGDVGTGKTAVAAFALAAVADSGTQAALMAPTSVLARQYATKVGPLLEAAGVTWALITGATPAAERADAVERIAAGEVSVVFGTTAVLSDDVAFRDLSLVVVDEQHRFGTSQRAGLRAKGRSADLLTMTATPIPRTLALSVYGDIACSRITQRPVAGAGVTTTTLTPETLNVGWTAIQEAMAAGHQAYVICPLVDDKDAGDDMTDDAVDADPESKRVRASAQTTAQKVARIFPEATIDILTGRLSAADKDRVMEGFSSGATNILVSTTVVEVGVDVPNATVMVVLDADSFGLATLHQLRGRVGRGEHAGSVYLVSPAKRGTPARDRLGALERTSDGFELANLDLRLRHEGELLGYRQHGGASLKVVDLSSDGALVDAAWADARAIVSDDPELTDPAHVMLAHEVRERFGIYFEEAGRS